VRSAVVISGGGLDQRILSRFRDDPYVVAGGARCGGQPKKTKIVWTISQLQSVVDHLIVHPRLPQNRAGIRPKDTPTPASACARIGLHAPPRAARADGMITYGDYSICRRLVSDLIDRNPGLEAIVLPTTRRQAATASAAAAVWCGAGHRITGFDNFNAAVPWSRR
jgi:hypothetical protein